MTLIIGSLSKRIFETRTATGRQRFACQDGGVSQIFILIKLKGKTAHFRLPSASQKSGCLSSLLSPVQTIATLGSLNTRVFETRTATGREHFARQNNGVPQIFILIISNGEKILSNVNVVVSRQVKSKNSSLPVAARVSKTGALKLPIRELKHVRS